MLGIELYKKLAKNMELSQCHSNELIFLKTQKKNHANMTNIRGHFNQLSTLENTTYYFQLEENKCNRDVRLR